MKAYLFFIGIIFSAVAYPAHYATIGDHFSKTKYKEFLKNSKNLKHQDIIYNTILINSKRKGGRINRGTGFFIGIHSGRPVFITNEHVMSTKECKDAKISILGPKGRKYIKCEKVLFSHGPSNESDITVFTISLKKVEGILGKGLKLDLDYIPQAGEKLMIAGFGLKNPPRLRYGSGLDRTLKKFNMEVSHDEDCVVATPSGRLYYADEIYMQDVFVTGCDLASGDSGAALYSTESRKVIGLIFGSTDSKFQLTSKEFQSLVGVEEYKFLEELGSYAMALNRYKELFKRHGISF